ncbi:serine protease [Sphaerothrix gracilis]|uniref:S1 family peptidase n=1 Tax=Sphaerothrix gracilis TaxID=3151835 RepID=UPI0031FCF6D1
MRKATFAALVSASALAGLQLPGLAQVDETIKSGPEINQISQETTLLIIGVEGNNRAHGSGSLIAKEGDRCVGVTNAHVVAFEDSRDFEFAVRTADREIHPVSEIRAFTQEDLALVVFECEQDYEPIPLATYQLSPGQDVYLSGWPADSTPDGSYVRQFTSGSISTLLDRPVSGYQVGYTNVTNSGMSGGQVLDAAGRLVAIHGVGAIQDARGIAARLNVSESVASELADKTGFNYGIPVTTFLARASQSGLNYPFNIVYSAPQNPANGPVAQGDYTYQPDASRANAYSKIGDTSG